MNRILAAALSVTGLLVLASPAAAAGEAAALKRALGPGVRVAEHEETGNVRFLGAAAGRPIPRPGGVAASAPPATAARAFLARHGRSFGIADQASELRTRTSERHGGRATVRFQQLESGVPVVGGELVVSLDGTGNVLSASGEILPDAAATTPSVSAATAAEKAIAATAWESQVSAVRLDATTPSLWIYDARLLGGPGPQHPTLVWRVEVKGESGVAVNQLVFVDATDGHVALRIDQIHEAKTRTVCDANNTSGAGGSYPCTAPVVIEGADPPAFGDDNDVSPAYEFAGDTYDFYLHRFNRDSLDGAGLRLRSTVDYCEPGQPCPYENAFWDGSQMAYGDGFALADDVVGHELTHGVTDFTSELFYYYQSGAINESLSDVFGELVDLTNGEGTDTAAVRWEIGEDLPSSFGVIRDMEDPESLGQPDDMTSSAYFGGTGDSGGVHTNSGVNNKAAFLLTDGGSHNGVTVTGLGITKVARIYYDVQTAFLTSGSDYADLASALPQACINRIGGAEGITAADCVEVSDAVAAVQMNTDSPAASAPDAPAAVCPTGQVRTDLFFDDFENPANTNWTGDANWGYAVGYAHSGKNMLYGFDSTAAGVSSWFMARSVTIPAGVPSAYLRFDHAYQFQSTGADGGVLEISTDNGATYQDIGPRITNVGYSGTIASASNPLNTRPAFVRLSNGYRSSRATLTSLAGQSVRVRFRIGTNSGMRAFGWIIDDVRIYSCAPPPDGDGDGVPDASDGCPSTPATTPNGCPAAIPTSPGTGGTTGRTTGGTTPATATLAQAGVRPCKRVGRRSKTRVRCTLRSFGAVSRATVTVKKGKRTAARKTVRPTRAGVLSIKPSRTLSKGTYKVTILLRDARGAKRTLKTNLRVR